MQHTPHFDNFDPVPFTVPSPADPALEYERGFAQGIQHATEAISTAQAILAAETVVALNDLAFGYHEARAHLLEHLAPLFRAITDLIVPQVLAQSMEMRIDWLLAEAATSIIDEPVPLRLPPEQAKAIGQRVALRPDITVISDPTLTEGQVLVGKTETLFDPVPLMDAIAQALQAITPAQQKAAQNE